MTRVAVPRPAHIPPRMNRCLRNAEKASTENARKKDSVYTLLGVLLPLFTTKVNSLTRYVNVLFPGFMALGIIGRESRWLPWVLLALFTLVLTIFSMRFAQWHWIP